MKIKIIQYGVGNMSTYIMKYAIEKGWEIIGAFDIDKKKIGKTIKLPNTEITIQAPEQFEDFLKENKPNIVIVTTTSLFKEVFETLKICANCGVNAITTCEECFYPQNSNYALYDELDTICKKNNCTITGSGYQDIFWGNLITNICGATNDIKQIKGTSQYNVDDYGIALAKAHGCNLSKEQFKKTFPIMEQENPVNPCYMWNVNGWLASKLGLHINKQTQKNIPIIATKDIYSKTLKTTIKKDKVIGMSAIVTSNTDENIEIITKCIGKIYSNTDNDLNSWQILGEPTTKLNISNPDTAKLTTDNFKSPEYIKNKLNFNE